MWLQGLNPEQQEAALHDFGPLLILAGAGSGKTTVLVSRTGRLITDQVATPKEICVLTFTNKSAQELKHRVALKLGRHAKGVWAGTFHSFGLQIIKKHHEFFKLPAKFGIIDTGDCHAILRDLLKDHKVVGKDKYDLDQLYKVVCDYRISELQKKLGARFAIPPTVQIEDEYQNAGEMLFTKYQKRLEHLGVVDFEDLLLKPVWLMKHQPEIKEKVQNMFTQVMVDEFQDTNNLQMFLIDQLIEKHQNITVVGDDDQSIYGWRGACVANILDFPKMYKGTKTVKLERNYRSHKGILAIANEVIGKNQKRHKKVLRAEKNSEGEQKPELFVFEDEAGESEFIAREIRSLIAEGFTHRDIAVLYRSNSQGGVVESELRINQIPYKITGGTALFDRKETKDVLAFLRASISQQEVSLRRIINTPPRGLGEASLEKILQTKEIQSVSFWEALKSSTAEGAQEIVELLEALPMELIRSPESVGDTLLKWLERIGYRKLIYENHRGSAGATDHRWMFIEILGRILDGFIARGERNIKTLIDFLDAMELRDFEFSQDEDKDEVQLLTLHASKGLEYPVVFLIGLEEEILPHKMLGSNIDEERRLFYVGVTRAKQRLLMSRCMNRKRYGRLRPSAPSRFLLEVSEHLFQLHANGFRPVSGASRDSLVSNFLSQLGKKIEQRP